MAHYAKISNDEFTVSERARLQEAQSEKNVIEANNRASEEYATLKTAYEDSFTSATLQALEGELDVLYSQYDSDLTPEEMEALNTSVNTKRAEMDAEKASLLSEQETALANLNAKEAEGTEALTSEIATLNTTIDNALCRVTEAHTGADEIEMVEGEEKDNTIYWEGYYGGCKRTSYNTQGGEHKLGGTPFRKNYAGTGSIYDPVRDAFYREQPYASWTLNESTCYWEPPTPRPEEGDWYWKEDTTEWVTYKDYTDPNLPSWIWNEEKQVWEAPIEYPSDGKLYEWSEETQQWIEL